MVISAMKGAHNYLLNRYMGSRKTVGAFNDSLNNQIQKHLFANFFKIQIYLIIILKAKVRINGQFFDLLKSKRIVTIN